MFKSRLANMLLAISVLILALALTGCSNKEPAGPVEKVIKIGFIGPLSGDMKAFGESTKNAFNLAV